MEEAQQKRKNGQIPAGITPEQAAEMPGRSIVSCKCVPEHEARVQVMERQKQWQQRWRERHEREGTSMMLLLSLKMLSLAGALEQQNKALAKRRAAEDALRIIAQKEAAVAAAAVASKL
ncbi:hypothetical protein WJX77_000755 [Trebouxia sp. C0004]